MVAFINIDTYAWCYSDYCHKKVHACHQQAYASAQLPVLAAGHALGRRVCFWSVACVRLRTQVPLWLPAVLERLASFANAPQPVKASVSQADGSEWAQCVCGRGGPRRR